MGNGERNGSDPKISLPIEVWNPPPTIISRAWKTGGVVQLIVNLALVGQVVGLIPIAGVIPKVVSALILLASNYGFKTALNFPSKEK